ncbi:hypothetical protein [Comamonas composti]|uniref:hypothetical protein n=1 Tax=Comamonas composti TaxID=408558 RepID=UPI0003FAB039|nr:hypothetical protein [Comamonas composti]
MKTSTDQHLDTTAQDAEEQTRFSEHFKARIAATVPYRIGDGALEEIPADTQVQVDKAIASFVVSWDSNSQPVVATISKHEFEYYVDEGKIEILS